MEFRAFANAFRLMWLSARDIGAPTIVEFDSEGNPIVVPNPVAQASRGDVYGGLLTFHLPKNWQWQSEYAWSYDDANLTDPTVKTLFGRAWRTIGTERSACVYKSNPPGCKTVRVQQVDATPSE